MLSKAYIGFILVIAISFSVMGKETNMKPGMGKLDFSEKSIQFLEELKNVVVMGIRIESAELKHSAGDHGVPMIQVRATPVAGFDVDQITLDQYWADKVFEKNGYYIVIVAFEEEGQQKLDHTPYLFQWEKADEKSIRARVEKETKTLEAAFEKQKAKHKQIALKYIESFRAENARFSTGFTPGLTGLKTNGEPDPEVLEIFKEHLKTESNEVAREKIIEILATLGYGGDDMSIAVITHPQVLQIMAQEGLSKPDSAKYRAMDILRESVITSDLARFEEDFVKALVNEPRSSAFLLVAKAKALKAKPIVDALAKTDDWKNNSDVLIAQAALGDTKIEEEMIKKFNSAASSKNVDKFLKELKVLSLVGTPKALKAIAEQLRTHLVSKGPGSSQKSVRLDVLDALQYNFPEQKVVYSGSIIEESDFTAAEKFCIEKLGVVYKKPPPAFMTYSGNYHF